MVSFEAPAARLLREEITDESIRSFVDAFYTKIRRDPVLAPIFTARLGARWGVHVATMRAFWCSALRVKPGYRGDMLAAHRRVQRLDRSLFPRWLALFEETAREYFAPEPAAALCDRARRIARNLETALFVPLPPRPVAPARDDTVRSTRAP